MDFRGSCSSLVATVFVLGAIAGTSRGQSLYCIDEGN
jgi:hypothetical protein